MNPGLDLAIEDWSKTAKTIALTDLNKVTFLDFQLGPDLSDEQFLGHCISDEKTYIAAICLNQVLNKMKCLETLEGPTWQNEIGLNSWARISGYLFSEDTYDHHPEFYFETSW